MEMKKFLILTLSVLLLCALCTSVMAVSIGTVINHTLYTDILADIDGHLLRSYNVDNHTVIVAEDLRAYAEEKGQTVTMAMERILRSYLDEEKRHTDTLKD